MSYRDWYVGMPVVCVGDFTRLASEEWAVVFGIEFPEKDCIYTIREIVEVVPEFEEEGTIGIRLREILNMPNPNRSAGGRLVDREIVFHPDEFRPLKKKAASISVFTSLLPPAKVTA